MTKPKVVAVYDDESLMKSPLGSNEGSSSGLLDTSEECVALRAEHAKNH